MHRPKADGELRGEIIGSEVGVAQPLLDLVQVLTSQFCVGSDLTLLGSELLRGDAVFERHAGCVEVGLRGSGAAQVIAMVEQLVGEVGEGGGDRRAEGPGCDGAVVLERFVRSQHSLGLLKRRDPGSIPPNPPQS